MSGTEDRLKLIGAVYIDVKRRSDQVAQTGKDMFCVDKDLNTLHPHLTTATALFGEGDPRTIRLAQRVAKREQDLIEATQRFANAELALHFALHQLEGTIEGAVGKGKLPEVVHKINEDLEAAIKLAEKDMSVLMAAINKTKENRNAKITLARYIAMLVTMQESVRRIC